MITGKMTSRGRITIPIEIRQALGFKPGDKLDVVRHEDGIMISRAERHEDEQVAMAQEAFQITEAITASEAKNARSE